MREAQEIRRKLFGNDRERATVFLAVVTGIDEDAFTCTVQVNNSVFYYDVRLRGLVKPELKGAAFIPKMESKVLVCRIGGSNELFVCQFTEIDKIIFTNEKMSFTLDQDEVLFEHEKVSLLIASDKMSLDVDGSTAELSKDGIVLNGGDLGAMVKIKELEDNLNSLKTFVEGMHNALPSAFTAIGSALEAVGGKGGTAYSLSMAGKMIQIKNMADDKVKH